MLRRTLVLLTVGGLVVLGGCGGNGNTTRPLPAAASAAQTEATPRIVAHGTGKVDGTPDVLTVQLGVETQAAQAAAALQDNNAKAASVIALLKGRGVAARDIQTSQLSINPRYDDKGQRITGYTVTNVVTARLRDLKSAGDLIDAAAGAAGDAIRVQGISFSIDDTSALFAQARKQAVTRAREQAQQLADAAGVKLGAVRSVTESSTQPTPKNLDVMGAMGGAAAAPLAVPVEAGSQTLTLDVEVVYDIAS